MLAPDQVDAMYRRTSKNEGGYVDDKDDAGGATKFGLSLRYAKAVGDRDGDGTAEFDLNKDGSVDSEDIKLLTPEKVRDEFLAEFYRKPNIDKLPAEIQSFVFDSGVHSGPSRAIMHVQNVINEAGFGPINVDGVCGPTTQRKAFLAQKEMGPFFVNALIEDRVAFFKRIMENNPSQSKYGGWFTRVDQYRV